MPGLTDLDRAVLDLMARTASTPMRQEAALMSLTGMSASAAWQRVDALVVSAAAVEYAPDACRRIRAVRARTRPVSFLRSA